MNVIVELDSLSRMEVGRSEVTLSLPAGATGRDVLRALVKTLPRLAQTTIDAQKGEFFDRETWLAYENRVGIPDLSVPLQVTDGARLLILSSVC